MNKNFYSSVLFWYTLYFLPPEVSIFSKISKALHWRASADVGCKKIIYISWRIFDLSIEITW